MSILCDLCEEVYTAKAQVNNRTTVQTDNGHVIDICYECAEQQVDDLSTEQLVYLVDGPA